MDWQPLLQQLPHRLRPLQEGEDDPLAIDSPHDADILPASPVDASVLVPILRVGSGFEVLFTKRTARLKNHAGQVSFPGGRREPADPNRLTTALRETHEEVGIVPSNVTPLGCLNSVLTITGFGVVPFVAMVDQSAPFQHDPVEVDQVFTVPLDYVLNRAHYTEQKVLFEGKRRVIHVLQYDGHSIWGATARMLIDLVDRVETT